MITTKAMPPILLCQPTSAVDVSGMAVDVETSYQHSIKFCCCATEGGKSFISFVLHKIRYYSFTDFWRDIVMSSCY